MVVSSLVLVGAPFVGGATAALVVTALGQDGGEGSARQQAERSEQECELFHAERGKVNNVELQT